MKRFVLVLVLLIVAASPLAARINVVGLPKRDAVELTIYNSVDLTMVRETRRLTVRKGLNRLEFSWANTLIDPTSLELIPRTHAGEIELLDASFPPRAPQTLEWRIQSEFSGEVEVEIRYFTSGIRWSADYVVEVETGERKMALAGFVRIYNDSGEDYENASVRLVVGVVRLVEELVTLARQNFRGLREEPTSRVLSLNYVVAKDVRDAFFEFDGLAGGGGSGRNRKEIIKEGLSEYFLYTVEGRETIPNAWSKRLQSFRTAEVPVTSYYKYEKEQWGDTVMRYYRFKNDAKSKLGTEPLPDGGVKAFRLINEEKLYAFAGRTAVKYIPVDEQVDLELGADSEVLVRPMLSAWAKVDLRFDSDGNVAGWTTTENWSIELQNSKDIEVVVDVRRSFGGDWSISTTQGYAKVDASKIKFVVPLKPGEKRSFSYQLTTRTGLNATR